MHRFVLHNGRVQKAEETSLAPGQVGLMNGWGVFSTLRVKEGVMFAFERHWRRMQGDAQLMRDFFEKQGGFEQRLLMHHACGRWMS